jgi:hypothetical protein
MTLSSAQALFREAVHDLAEEPNPLNVQRYLAASQILDRAGPAEPAASEGQRVGALALENS